MPRLPAGGRAAVRRCFAAWPGGVGRAESPCAGPRSRHRASLLEPRLCGRGDGRAGRRAAGHGSRWWRQAWTGESALLGIAARSYRRVVSSAMGRSFRGSRVVAAGYAAGSVLGAVATEAEFATNGGGADSGGPRGYSAASRTAESGRTENPPSVPRTVEPSSETRPRSRLVVLLAGDGREDVEVAVGAHYDHRFGRVQGYAGHTAVRSALRCERLNGDPALSAACHGGA